MKQFGLLLLLASIFPDILANSVTKIVVHTADCEDCGMSIFGELSVQLCGNGPSPCCVAERLDNPLGNDFNEGTESSFSGSALKMCNGFDLGAKTDWSNFMTIFHSGLDGGKFDWVKVETDQGLTIKCIFTKFLDDGDFESGKECAQI